MLFLNSAGIIPIFLIFSINSSARPLAATFKTAILERHL